MAESKIAVALLAQPVSKAIRVAAKKLRKTFTSGHEKDVPNFQRDVKYVVDSSYLLTRIDSKWD